MNVNGQVYESCPPEFLLYGNKENYFREIIAESHCHSNLKKWLILTPVPCISIIL